MALELVYSLLKIVSNVTKDYRYIQQNKYIVAHMISVFFTIKSVLVDLCRGGKFHLLAKR